MRINCHIPITLRIVGIPTDDQLEALGRSLTRAVVARLAEAERVLAERYQVGVNGSVEISTAHPAAARDAEVPSGQAVFELASLAEPSQPLIVPATAPVTGPAALPPAGGGAIASPSVRWAGETSALPMGRLTPATVDDQETRPSNVLGDAPVTLTPERIPADPFDEALREAQREAILNPPARDPEQIRPGSWLQQTETIEEIIPLHYWRLPRIQDPMRRLAQAMEQWERSRPNFSGTVTYDTTYWMDRWQELFTTSMTYILYHRTYRQGRTRRGWHLAKLAKEEALIRAMLPPAGLGGQALAMWATGMGTRVTALRLTARDDWLKAVDRAADRLVVLFENHAQFLTVHQNTRSIKIYGLPEWIEGTVRASDHPDAVAQDPDSPGYSPSVIKFMKALRLVWGKPVVASNYKDHERHSSYLGNIEDVGKYSFDVHLDGLVRTNDQGFYDREEMVAFFLAAERAGKDTRIAWVAYYNDFDVARRVNEHPTVGVRRIGFSGAGSPRDAPPELRGSIHHGPEPYILHIHFNIMPNDQAMQYFAGRNFADLPMVDMGGSP